MAKDLEHLQVLYVPFPQNLGSCPVVFPVPKERVWRV